MANDVFTLQHDTTGATLYALIRDDDGQVADVAVDNAFEAFADASLGDYDLAGTEQGTASRCYAFTFPSWISAGTYKVDIFEQAGGSPAVTDDLVGSGVIHWDGSAIVSYSATRGLAGTALPNAAADAAGGLPTSDAGGLDMDAIQTGITAIKAITDAIGATAAANLAKTLGNSGVINGTVDTATNSHTPTTTEFQADDITEATDDHYNGRVVIWLTGALAGQATDITDYTTEGGIGQFTVTALTEAPANNDTFVII